MGASVLNVLSDPAGWVPLSLNVSGTLEQPNVRLDTKALLAQAKQGTKREAKEAAQRAAEQAKDGGQRKGEPRRSRRVLPEKTLSQSTVQSASDVTSLMNRRFPEMAACGQVSLVATL